MHQITFKADAFRRGLFLFTWIVFREVKIIYKIQRLRLIFEEAVLGAIW